jgi:hypothetical protein
LPETSRYPASKLIQAYIDHTLKFEEKKEWLETFFEARNLQRRKIIVELESGIEPKNMNLYFAEHELLSMREQKYLKLEEYNKKQFPHGEAVELHLKLKNISKLAVKIFEVNTQSYYRKNKAQFKEDIDLDGLIPNFSKEYDLSSLSPLTSIRKTIEFPEIASKERGIFVIEFIGGGLSSRAVIRKGGLMVIKQPSAKGITFNVVNEKKEFCGENSSMLVGGQIYRPDASGDILIPYGTRPVNEQAVVMHGDFADIVPVTVPSEAYAFLTSLIFNEESLVPGNVAKLIIHPKLIFNGRACTIKYVKNNKVLINSTNDAGIKSQTVYNDVNFSYENDTVINYLVPPKLKQIEVVCQGTITLVDGTELNVSTNEFIQINKFEHRDIFFDVYLRLTGGNYYLHLLGKNGEPLSGKVLNVKLKHKYLTSSNHSSVELKTTEEGTVKLGALKDIRSIDVSFGNSGLDPITWQIDNQVDTMHIQSSYHICAGEELVLPALNGTLNNSSHQLLRHSATDRRVMSNEFSSASQQFNSFVLKLDKPGLYIFTYLETGFSVEITVIQGERWKFSKNFIAESHQLTKMISDLSYMTVESLTVEGSKVKAKINCNNPSQLKVHALGYTFMPTYFPTLHSTVRKMCPHYARETFGFPQCENSYLSEKLLGDEVNYVLARKTKPSFMGNTLEKPPILLKRHFNKDTTETEEQLQTGKDFQNKDLGRAAGAFIKEEKAKLSMPPPRTFRVKRISDFLANSSLTLTNLKADDQGFVEFELPKDVHLCTLRLLASDVMSNVSVDIPLTSSTVTLNDVRLATSKQAGTTYGATRFAQTAVEGGQLIVKDHNNTDSFIVDNLESVFGILKTQSGYFNKQSAVEFDKWRFLLNWEALTFPEKMKKYDEFCGHELNVFLYFKDRSFFDTYVLKFIHSKSSYDKVDKILLGKEKDVRGFLDFMNFSELTPLELALTILMFREKDPKLCNALISTIESITSSNKMDENQFRKHFDTVLSHKLDESAPVTTTTAVTQNKRLMGAIPMAAPEPALARPMMYAARGLQRRDSRERMRAPAPLAAAAPKMERALSICRMASVELNDDMASVNQSIRSRSRSNTPPKRPQIVRKSSIRQRFDSSDYLPPVADINQPLAAAKYDRFDGIIEEDGEVDRRAVVPQKKHEATKEYVERHYYFSKEVGRSRVNAFWLNTIRGLFEHGAGFVNLDLNFIFCAESLIDMVAVLALLSLPYAKAVVETRREGSNLVIAVQSGRVIQFCKQMNEGSTGKVDMDIIVSQRFYDPLDKYIYDETNPNISTLKRIEEFLVGKIYTSRVAVTNSSESVVEIEVVCEIPQGAVPVNCLDYTKTYIMRPNPLQTMIKEFNFYFPREGEFSVYPATALKNNMLITYAQLAAPTLRVVKKKTAKGMMDSISEILVSGSKTDILAFIETKNIRNSKIFNFEDIYWLLKDEKFFLSVVDILRRRFIFDGTTWAFSVYHGAKREFFEYLQATKRAFGLKYFKGGALLVDSFAAKEYSPLTNPRTHNIGNKKHNIANKDFKDTYAEFLQYAFEKGELANADRLALCSYLVMQDRIEEALRQMGLVVRDRSLEQEELRVQLDYLTAYLSFYTEYPAFSTAAAISQKYVDYHVPTWRNRFLRIANQLAEFKGGQQTFDIEDKKFDHEKRIGKSEQLKIKLADGVITASVRNVGRLTLSFYEIDIEVLYSRDPFFNKDMTNSFNDVFPTVMQTHDVAASEAEQELVFAIPEALKAKNLVIYVQSALVSEKVQYFPSELDVVAASEAGYVRVTDQHKRPLAQTYVKAFAQALDGSVAFYKDGYTDMRGIFDYATLNADKLASIDKFALLVCSASLGAVTKVVGKPTRLAHFLDDVAPARMLLDGDVR